jgi:iron(III) transport system substrate-binding protein
MGHRKPRAIARLAGAVSLLSCLATAAAAQTAAPDWMMPDKLQAAKAEGSVVVYSSVNEGEALPVWRIFEEATGVKVQFVRGSDVAINSRIAIEGRAGQQSWDITVTTAVSQNPPQLLAPFDPPEARNLIPIARAPDRRWYGHSINYNTPSYNTKLVDRADLPVSFEDLATRAQWRGRVAVEGTDTQWLAGMFQHFGEAKARAILGDIVRVLDPVVADGHLALARQVAAGEYALTLNNFLNLTNAVKMGGGPTEAFALDPVSAHVAQVGVSARAPHPNAALLAANFAISREAQAHSAVYGRMPVRADVTPNPPDALARIAGKTILPTLFGPEDDRKWKRIFDEIFRRR